MTVPDSTPAKEEKSKKRTRNPVERVIVWGLIAVAAGVAGWEFRAQSGYKSSLAYIQNRVDEVNGAADAVDVPALKFGEVRDHLSGGPRVSGMERTALGEKTRSLKWPSLFKRYELVLIVNNETDEAVVYNVRPAVD